MEKFSQKRIIESVLKGKIAQKEKIDQTCTDNSAHIFELCMNLHVLEEAKKKLHKSSIKIAGWGALGVVAGVFWGRSVCNLIFDANLPYLDAGFLATAGILGVMGGFCAKFILDDIADKTIFNQKIIIQDDLENSMAQIKTNFKQKATIEEEISTLEAQISTLETSLSR